MAHAMRASDRFDHIQLACLCIYFFLFALFLRGSTRFYEVLIVKMLLLVNGS